MRRRGSVATRFTSKATWNSLCSPLFKTVFVLLDVKELIHRNTVIGMRNGKLKGFLKSKLKSTVRHRAI